MKAYEALTLGRLIATLKSLGDAQVRGLNGSIRSYRGYYERTSTEPNSDTHSAKDLANWYQDQIGEPMFGYKGGDYTVDADELIYYAGYGDTGPNIIGLEKGSDGVYELVLLGGDTWML